MKILVIGSGGREHALAWKLAQSPRVSEVLVAPGNAGTATESKCRNVDVAAGDIDGLLALARNEDVAVTVVGPEGPLVAGVVDRFRAQGLRVFGPTAAAAASFLNGGDGLFTDPPSCFLHQQASFYGGIAMGNFPDVAPIEGIDFFPFPDVDPAYAGLRQISGEMVGLFNDTPQARALVAADTQREEADEHRDVQVL